MQSTNLTQAVLGTLADAYPQAIQIPKLAAQVDCEMPALCKHLRLLQEVGAIHADARGGVLEAASITDTGLSIMRRHTDVAHGARQSKWRR